MCDMAEEEFAEYLRWLEVSEARARVRIPRASPPRDETVLSGEPEPAVALAA